MGSANTLTPPTVERTFTFSRFIWRAAFAKRSSTAYHVGGLRPSDSCSLAALIISLADAETWSRRMRNLSAFSESEARRASME